MATNANLPPLRRVFLSAGEASGDAYGAALVRELGGANPELSFQGIGGKQMREAGASLVADSSRWGAIGVAQGLKIVPRATRGYWAAVRSLKHGDPGLFIPIDFGFFNMKLLRRARQAGWKVLYFMPPGSWRRDRQGKDLPAVADEIVTPFPWSADLLREMGANVHWFGHPLKQLLQEKREANPVRDSKTVAVLPGSRAHEIELNLPAVAEGIRDVARDLNIKVEVSVAASLDAEFVRQRWRKLSGRDHDEFIQGDNAGILSRATAAVVCSGTATLEAALCGCPMVIVYNVSPGMAFQGYVIHGKPKFIGLPNILLQRMAVPELVHHDLTGPKVAAAVRALLDASPARREQIEAFREIDEITGSPDAITKTAQLALGMLEG